MVSNQLKFKVYIVVYQSGLFMHFNACFVACQRRLGGGEFKRLLLLLLFLLFAVASIFMSPGARALALT